MSKIGLVKNGVLVNCLKYCGNYNDTKLFMAKIFKRVYKNVHYKPIMAKCLKKTTLKGYASKCSLLTKSIMHDFVLSMHLCICYCFTNKKYINCVIRTETTQQFFKNQITRYRFTLLRLCNLEGSTMSNNLIRRMVQSQMTSHGRFSPLRYPGQGTGRNKGFSYQ